MELTCSTIRCSLRRILPSPARRTLSIIAGTSCRAPRGLVWLAGHARHDRHRLAASGLTARPASCHSLIAMVGEIRGLAEPTGTWSDPADFAQAHPHTMIC